MRFTLPSALLASALISALPSAEAQTTRSNSTRPTTTTRATTTTRPTTTRTASSTRPTTTTRPTPAASTRATPTSAADIPTTLRQLAIPETHDQALTLLKSMPESAIIPLWDFAMDPAQPVSLRKDVAFALDDIFRRAREIRIPQANRDALAWRTASTVDIIKKFPQNPQFDALIIQAFNDFNANSPNLDQSIKAALEAGTHDPELRLLQISRDPKESGPNTSLEGMLELQKITADFETSHYPASRKLLAYQYFLDRATLASCPPEITLDRKVRAVDRIVALFPEFLAEKPGRYMTKNSRAGLILHATQIYDDLGMGGGGPRKQGFDQIFPPLIKALPNDSRILWIQAEFYKNYAWDARGDGFADTVTPEAAKLFSERLDLAASIALKAWRLDPLDPDPPALMITIAMGKGYDKNTMESWFLRALNADPRNYDACSAKMNYLLPKWGGSEREVLEFGRWCVQHGDGYDRIPTILIRAHEDMRNFADDPGAYIERSLVWTDYASVYQKLLADPDRLKTNRTAYLIDRSNYILAATNAKQWKNAKQLMDQFGDEIDLPTLGGKAPYDYLKRKATNESAK